MLLLFLGTTLVACSSSTDPGDAAADVAVDVALDVPADIATDVLRDASPDVAADAARDVASDAPSDVASDAPSDVASDVAAPVCDVSTVYTFGPDGGFVAYRDAYRIEPGLRFTYTRTGAGLGDAGMASCTTTLAACGVGDGSVLDTRAVLDALASADVAAAFADQSNTVYGRDSRPVDGQVFSIARADGRHFEVGNDCGGASGCRAIPAGLARLRTVMTDLAAQQSARSECAGVRP